ncbi:MAG TPA: ATP-binding cassette domain-containing protein [Hyphomicrobiaceae bacterium]|nr:ATP-binding cassette domain-containing protein [Hyphomicrobiaceae bacterium]
MLKSAESAQAANATTHSLFPMVATDLCFADRGRTLIDHLSLTLLGRGTTAIMGSNGAGKSLLLRLLHGLLQPTSGSILWGGKPLDDTIRARQAMVFQRPTMLRRSAIDNLRFVLADLPRRERERRVGELISEAKLEHVAMTPARLLSGGEQQRLAIARARASEPEVLFLDEPAASLDPASTHAIEELTRTIHADGIKVVIVTHDRGQAKRLADEVVFIDKGRIAEQSAASDFFANPASQAARNYLEGRLAL